MSRRAVATLVVVAAVLGGVWAVVAIAGGGREPEVTGLARGVAPIFGDTDALPAGPTRAVFSPDGARLAVLDRGRVAAVENGRLRYVTEPGTRVVDVAWFGQSDVLLVAEGPVPTGGLAIVESDGDVRATLPLEPGLGFGSGSGAAVAPGNRRAVVTAVERPPLAPDDERHLALVDLETGGSRALTEPGGDDEHGPSFVDATRVFFTDGERVAVLDVDTGERRTIGRGRALGVVRGRWLAYVDAGRVVARPVPDAWAGPGDEAAERPGGSPAETVTLATLGDGQIAVAVDPAGSAVLVLAVEQRPDGTTFARLRAVRIRGLPSEQR